MFNFLKKKKVPENLNGVFNYLGRLESNLKTLSKELENLKKENLFSLKKIGILRYNPFSDIGGNQSFSIALLDGNDNGLVITSLYSREGNRVYGKPIKKGNSEHTLSNEEKEVIERARGSQVLKPKS